MEPRRTLRDRIVERVPMTIPQYVDLGGQSYGSAEDWTRLRTADGPFALEARAVWLAGSKQLEIRNRAEAIAGVARELGATRIASSGVGTGMLEQALAEAALPRLHRDLLRFHPRRPQGPRGVLRRVRSPRARSDTDDPVEADLHPFHRVETEFDNAGWREVFRRLRVERILFTGEFVLTWARARYLIALAAKCAGDRGGHLRTPAALRRLWWNTHGAEAVGVGDLPGFLHTPRGGS